MSKSQKILGLMLCLVILIGTLSVLYVHRKTFFPFWFGPKKYTGQIFGKPNGKAETNFPKDNPQFKAKMDTLKSSTLNQQSINVFSINKTNDSPIFSRNFYADGFRGKVLTYSFPSNSATIQQSGSIGNLGCGTGCSLIWSNFYTWDDKQKIFLLDNTSHKEFFQQMHITYESIDKRGCTIASANVIPSQLGLSFTKIYAKYPTENWYCNKTQGILPNNLTLFLKAKKAVEKILEGQNISSNDIQNLGI